MNKEELLKRIDVIVLQRIYREGRFIESGESYKACRYEFSKSHMVAVDEKGEPLKTQPKELDDRETRKTLAGGDSKKAPSYSAPIITQETIDARDAELASEGEEAELPPIEAPKESEGVASLV
ncbi:MAG: hypothetical protein Unbinned1322contig1000_56 [Prokaryotic dsDNA virus sp.]|nr:hypothetical protein [Aequorivita sp.]QDP57312.1 MAG: hypothetical protein Unbinned1322contig1000_56 [Prokaryotic dsDNA virus sp.]|tara:strand:+ start:8306 stop:8674 length:369 start_codon:yes stop_codon:yes gene_type:complete